MAYNPNNITVTDPRQLLTIVDVRSSVLRFIGEAPLGSETDEAVWRISRVITQGGITTTDYVTTDGKAEFNQIWDDRDSLFPTPVLDNPASLLFDGSNEFITLGDNYTFGPAQAFSWSFWFKAQNFASQRAFIAKTSQDANVHGYSFQHNSSGKLFAQMRAPATLRQHTYSSTLTAGVWTHSVFTYAGGSNISGLLAYINASVEPAPASGSLAAWTVTDPLTFANRGNTFHFSGNMNQISVWNKALTSSEVTELYNSGTPGDLTQHSAYATLLSWWGLNDGSNFPTEVDLEGSINGTLTNMEIGDYDTGDVP